MVSALEATRLKKQHSELRPLDLGRDLGQLRELVAEVFHDDWSPEGNRTMRELRYMHWFSPLVWLLARIDLEFRDSLSGVVWLEQGQLVGNVTVGVISGTRWFVSNVAVREAYRGRGLGRRLVGAALDLIKERGGREAVLQVRADNAVAIHIYQSFGFKTYNAFTQMQAPVAAQAGLFCDEIALPAAYRWHPLRYADWPDEYKLALDATPKDKQRVHPIYERRYRQDVDERLEKWLDDLLHLRGVHRWAIMCQDEIVATLTVTAQRLAAPHRVKLIVHPAHRGRVEMALVRRVLSILSKYPARMIYSGVNTAYPETIGALLQGGFEAVRTLNQMYVRLR